MCALSSPALGGTRRAPSSARRSAIVPDRFRHFAAIDWSGAVGERQRGIAVAICSSGTDVPQLVRGDQVWSRAEILSWLANDLPADTLIGLDLGLSLPFADQRAFFPGWAESPPDARTLWALIDGICAHDPHFTATSFVDHPEVSRHFHRHGGRRGEHFRGTGRLRRTEEAQRRQGLRPYSNLNLVGAAQVGKSSLTGMRVLHRLAGRLPVWPFDPLPAGGSAIVEIYTSIAALAAGRSAGRTKIRDGEALDVALKALGSAPARCRGATDDHRSDALLTAAWLRKAASEPGLWSPLELTAALARTEGWTFGVR